MYTHQRQQQHLMYIDINQPSLIFLYNVYAFIHIYDSIIWNHGYTFLPIFVHQTLDANVLQQELKVGTKEMLDHMLLDWADNLDYI